MVESRVTRVAPPARRRSDARVHLPPARRDRDLRVQREHLADVADRELHDEVVRRRLAQRGRPRRALAVGQGRARRDGDRARARDARRDRGLALPASSARETISFLVILPIALPGIVTGLALQATILERSRAARDQLQHLDDHHRARDLLHRRRLQQRRRAHAPDRRARSRRRRWISAPTRGRRSAT